MNSKPNFTNNPWSEFCWLLAALALCLTVLARGETPPAAIPFSDIAARASANYQGDALGVTATADGARLRCGFQKLEGHATPEGLWLESTKPGGGQLRLVAVAVGRGGSRARQCALTEAASSIRSGMSIVTVPQDDQAPLGAPGTHGAAGFFDMPLPMNRGGNAEENGLLSPALSSRGGEGALGLGSLAEVTDQLVGLALLTELETSFSDVPCHRHAAPNGAGACLTSGAETLSRTGTVSVQDKLVRFTRPGLTEEYSVSVDGVRQDFIIASPPLNHQLSTLNQSAAALRVELALSGAGAEAAVGGARLRLDGSGRTLAYSRLRVEDATGREMAARLEVLSADRLAVTVADANAIYPVRIDPTFSDADWVSLNPEQQGPNDQVKAIAVDDSGNVYVGGDFRSVGMVTANHIAKWDGSTWSVLGSGLSGGEQSGIVVSALAVSGTDLYAGGSFTNAGGLLANCIAKWDGSAWSALGAGIGVSGSYAPFVTALAVSGSDLYAGGGFTRAGGVPANNIAKWDGSKWSALGSGMNGNISALAVSGTNLYAGGTFTTAGGVPANNIARWDGSGWSALGSGTDHTITGLAVSGTDLYAGGHFSTAGGVAVNYVAKWNGSTWSALGSGLTGVRLMAMVALTAVGGNVYAGGEFATAGGLTANCVAKWDGSAWTALGSGTDRFVRALAGSGTNLFVGGGFSRAGTNVSPFIAEAHIGGAPPRILHQPTNQNALVGSGVEFTVTAVGLGSLYYQWLFNGTNIAGIASADCCLQLTNVQPGQAGAYTVVITNAYGAVTGAPALLLVFDRTPPIFVTAPTDRTVPVGATVDFAAAATGFLPLGYYWFFNGTNAEGSGTNLHLADVQLAQAGAYTVVVSNLYGAMTSAPAWLTVTGVPPAIVSSPGNQRSWTGGTVSFLVTATGTSPLAYQWFFGANPISGATNFTLQLTNVQLWQSGVYSVVITNLYGVVTSAAATLEVVPAWVVMTNSEAALRAAMSGGGRVGFGCDGTITLTSTITNDLDVTLDGTGHQITISGGNTVRVFSVNTNVSLTVVNLSLVGGWSLCGSAILNLGGTVNLSGVSLNGNTAFNVAGNDPSSSPRAMGGAILNRGGTIHATNCSFAGNMVATFGLGGLALPAWGGGAIRNESGQVNLQSCSFSGNQTGASFNLSGSPNGDSGQGGAIDNSGTLTLDLCAFTGNSAMGSDGFDASLVTRGSGVRGGSGGSGLGGAICNGGTMRADRTTFSGNAATGGNGGNGNSGSDNQGSLNGAPGGGGGGAYGGAIYGGTLWITRSTLVNNVVTGGNGGSGGSGGSSVPWDPHFGGNGAAGGNAGSGVGGAVDGAGSLVNCTIAFNSGSGGVGGRGGYGGYGFTSGGSGGPGGNGGSGGGGVQGMCLTNCTLARNRGNGGGGGAGGAIQPGSAGGVPGADGTGGGSWGAATSSVLVNTLMASNTPAGGDTFTDPKLGPLADNGGPTLTMALLPGSPAIDAGITSLAPPLDQRGFLRPAGLAADIGAYEYGAVRWGPPVIQTSPETQTAEEGGSVDLSVEASGAWPLFCLWYFNDTFLDICSTNGEAGLTNLQFSQSGSYTLVVTNVFGATTNTPFMLNVIAPVERRPVPGLKVTGEVGGLLNLDSADSLSPAPNWTTLGAVSVTSTSDYYFDLTQPLPAQRYYQAWQTGTPRMVPPLDLHMIPAITLTGSIGSSVRVDAINRYGPTDAWFTLDTVRLTNTSQLYFDSSVVGQPQRLYRLVPLP